MHSGEGGQNVDVMSWERGGIFDDGGSNFPTLMGGLIPGQM